MERQKVFGANNKMKVVWICHFSNGMIRKKLGVKESRDFAPWITLSIDEFNKRTDIDLYIVAPHKNLKQNISFEMDNVKYHFIKTGVPFVRREWPKFFKIDVWSNYYFNSKKIEKIVRKIDPDIINLQGAENAYYSASVLRLVDYPVMINIQGLLAGSVPGNSKPHQARLKFEYEILKKFKYFGYRNNEYKKFVLNINPEAKFFWQEYPIRNSISEINQNQEKEYDIVFFAHISKNKGVFDLIEAVSQINIKYNLSVTVKLFGPLTPESKVLVKSFIEERNLLKQIKLVGPLTTQQAVHKEASKAKISVLPTYYDTIPGTIIESMFLKLPVVTYNTGDIPILNNQRESVIIVDKGRIEKLAFEIHHLLTNKNEYQKISENAYRTAIENYKNDIKIDQLINNYKEILNNL